MKILRFGRISHPPSIFGAPTTHLVPIFFQGLKFNWRNKQKTLQGRLFPAVCRVTDHSVKGRGEGQWPARLGGLPGGGEAQSRLPSSSKTGHKQESGPGGTFPTAAR